MTILRRTSTKVVVEFGVPPTPAVPDRVERRLISTSTTTNNTTTTGTTTRQPGATTPAPTPKPVKREVKISNAVKSKYALSSMEPRINPTSLPTYLSPSQKGLWTAPQISNELGAMISTMGLPILATVLPSRIKGVDGEWFDVNYGGSSTGGASGDIKLERLMVYHHHARKQSELIGRICLFDWVQPMLKKQPSFIPLYVERFPLPGRTNDPMNDTFYGFRLGLSGYRPAKWGIFSQVNTVIMDVFTDAGSDLPLAAYHNSSGIWGVDECPFYGMAYSNHGTTATLPLYANAHPAEW